MKYFEGTLFVLLISSIIIGLDFGQEIELVPQIRARFKQYQNLFQNLSMDGNNATCAVSEYKKNSQFVYELRTTMKIKRMTVIMINHDDDEFKILVSVSNSSSENVRQCNILMDVRRSFIFQGRVKVNVECEDGITGNVITITDDRNSNEFFAICELTIFGESSMDSPSPSKMNAGFFEQPSIEHLYIGLGCLALLILLIIIVALLVKRERRRRNSESAPYYAWSNGQNAGSDETITDCRAPSNAGEMPIPGHSQVPLPLPRDALHHLRERSDANHYSVIRGQSDYLDILPDPNNKGTFDPHLYEKCYSGRKEESLYADCTVIPQPPNTRFSELGSLVRSPPRP